MPAVLDIEPEEEAFLPENKEPEGGMSLSSKINLANPMLREWVNNRKSNIRPVGVFFNTSNFQVAPSPGRLTKRFYKNIEYFQSNYVLVFLVLFVYCLVTSPLLLLVLLSGGGACYFVSTRNQEQKILIAGHEVTLAAQYSLTLLLCIPLLILAGATGVVFWVLGASLFVISGHAAFYNYDALEVPEDQEKLTGEIIEEV